MPIRYSEEMPLGALRDLIGIVRALFATMTAEKGDPVQLQELVEIGKLLRSAYDDARTMPAGSLGHRSGWDKAQGAIQRLSLLLVDAMPLRPVALKAGERVIEGGKPAPNELTMVQREARRQHRLKRN
jgi:hypothetical protein